MLQGPIGVGVGVCEGVGDGSGVGDKGIVAAGEAAVKAGKSNVDVAFGSTSTITVGFTVSVDRTAGMELAGDSEITSGIVARGAGRQPVKSSPRRKTKANNKIGIRTIRCRLLGSRFHICYPA
jgi:hypothetical protein